MISATSASASEMLTPAPGHQHGGLRERCEQHFAARADAAEARADIEPREREQEARGSEQRHDDDEIGGGARRETGRERRHQCGGHPGRGEDQVGGGTEEPRGVLGDDGFLADQFQQVAIRLQDRRSLAAQEPGADLACHAGQERSEPEDQSRLRELDEPVVGAHRQAPTMIRSVTSAANTSVR
jgi:hypothetical protein